MTAQLVCPNESQLLRWRVGCESFDGLQEHVAVCPHCRNRIAGLQREEELFRRCNASADQGFGPDHGDSQWTDAVRSDFPGHPRIDVGRIGRYEILDAVAQGGQADVYLAYHPRLECEVIIKLERKPLCGGLAERSKIRIEARILARLSHPGLARILDLDIHDGRPFLVLERVEGRTMLETVRCKRPSPSEIRDWMTQLADAVEAAHQQQVLHLDIKPENVIVTKSGSIKLIDFGAAGVLFGSRLTVDGDWMVGTPGYMAPEQEALDRSEMSTRTDVFGLGGVLYFLLFGEPPVRPHADSPSFRPAPRPAWTSRLVADSSGQSDSAGEDAADPRLVDVCRRALASDPGDRMQTAAAYADAVRATAPPPHRARRRHLYRGLTLLGAALLMPLALWRADESTDVNPLASPVGMIAEVQTESGWMPLATAAPLREQDGIRVTLAANDESVPWLYLVLDPSLVTPCRPLELTGDGYRFPSHNDAFPIRQLSACCLLLAGTACQDPRPSREELIALLQGTQFRLPDDVAQFSFHGPNADESERVRFDSEVSGWTSPLAAQAVQKLRAVLDSHLNAYEATLVRFDATEAS